MNVGQQPQEGTSKVAKDILSITAPDGVVYEFEKPEFECKIFYRNSKYRTIHGIIFEEGNTYSIEWNHAGKVLNVTLSRGVKNYNLTPIKKEWYEYPENFPALLKHDWYKIFNTVYYMEDVLALNKHWRLATKEEVMSLYLEDK